MQTNRTSNSNDDWRHRPVAVLVSGGVDSAVLLGELAARSPKVVPIYVRTGMIWENIEEEHLRQFIGALKSPNVANLVCFDVAVRSIYGNHWSTTGNDTPDEASPDEAVFLPGRNLLLLVQPLLWCHTHGIDSIAMATLKGNPFPDATPRFFDDFAKLFSQATAGRVAIQLPYRDMSKAEVIQRGSKFPLQHSFSCIHPIDGMHCGVCNKCEERRHGFQIAGVADPTRYHKTRSKSEQPCTA